MQVVLVGAGMDTRAWRLKLAAGVSWLEVDQQRVLDAKLATLRHEGAQTSHLNGDNSTTHFLACSTYQAVRAPRHASCAAASAACPVACSAQVCGSAL